jgi:hypothetical protein
MVAVVSICGFAALGSASVDEPRDIQRQSHQEIFVQALSPRCATPVGICFVQPQPIGSPCLCGQNQGTIIP